MGSAKTRTLAAILVVGLGAPTAAQSGHVHPAPKTTDSTKIAGMADHVMSGPMSANMMKHMELTPTHVATRADSNKALALAAELKQAIAKYRDTAAAVADG